MCNESFASWRSGINVLPCTSYPRIEPPHSNFFKNNTLIENKKEKKYGHCRDRLPAKHSPLKTDPPPRG